MSRIKPLLFALGLASPLALADPLKIGTTAAFAPPLEVAVQEAKAAGVDVEIVEFSDWIAPNTSLAKHNIDANHYQHVSFRENAKRTAGYDLVPVASGIINNVGLYSKKYKTLAEVPKGARVVIANDAISGGRGLLLLEKAGFITLRPGIGYDVTLADITGNPHDIQIVELEAVQLARWTTSTWSRAIRTTCAWPRP